MRPTLPLSVQDPQFPLVRGPPLDQSRTGGLGSLSGPSHPTRHTRHGAWWWDGLKRVFEPGGRTDISHTLNTSLSPSDDRWSLDGGVGGTQDTPGVGTLVPYVRCLHVGRF